MMLHSKSSKERDLMKFVSEYQVRSKIVLRNDGQRYIKKYLQFETAFNSKISSVKNCFQATELLLNFYTIKKMKNPISHLLSMLNCFQLNFRWCFLYGSQLITLTMITLSCFHYILLYSRSCLMWSLWARLNLITISKWLQ